MLVLSGVITFLYGILLAHGTADSLAAKAVWVTRAD
jgi:hypothetical protein